MHTASGNLCLQSTLPRPALCFLPSYRDASKPGLLLAPHLERPRWPLLRHRRVPRQAWHGGVPVPHGSVAERRHHQFEVRDAVSQGPGRDLNDLLPLLPILRRNARSREREREGRSKQACMHACMQHARTHAATGCHQEAGSLRFIEEKRIIKSVGTR